MRRNNWVIVIGCAVVLLCAACGQSTLTPVAKVLQQAQHAALRDATFTVTFMADNAQNVGTGTLTTQPARFALTVKHIAGATAPVTLSVIGVTVGQNFALYARVSNDSLWSTLNDGEDGYFVNDDTDIVNYDQLSAPTLVGAATTASQRTWHVRATVSMHLYAQDGTLIPVSGTEDLWLRQADGFPVAIQKAVTGSGTASDGTATTLSLQASYQFTAWNTGITVPLPDPSQVAASG